MENIYARMDEEKRCLLIQINKNIGASMFEEGYTLDDFTASFKEKDFDEIVLEMTSLGGNVIEAFSIYNILEYYTSQGKKITTNFIGVNASASTIIGMAGQERNMQSTGMFLIHNSSGAVRGNAESMEKTIDDLKNIDKQMVDIYYSKTGLAKNVIQDLMQKEKWLSAKQALKYGFITNILETGKKITSEILEEITAHAEFPDLKNNLEEMQIEEIKAKYEIGEEVELEAGLEAYVAKQTEVLTSELNSKNEEITAKQTEIDNLIIKYNSEFLAKESEVAEITAKLTEKEADFTAKISEKEKEILDINSKLKDIEIENVLVDGIRNEKISASVKEDFRALLKSNFDLTKSLIEKSDIKRTSTMTAMVEEKDSDPKASWSFSEWTKNDEKGLAEMKTANFEKFKELYKSEFKKEYGIE